MQGKKKERRQEEHAAPWLTAMCQLLKGGVMSAVVGVAALFLCSALVSAGVLREGLMDSAVLASCVAGGLAGGLFAVRGIGARTLLVGIGTGIVQFLLLLSLGFLLYEGASLANGGLHILCACAGGGAIAGILGGKPKKKRKR